jgi:hypothetical protein
MRFPAVLRNVTYTKFLLRLSIVSVSVQLKAYAETSEKSKSFTYNSKFSVSKQALANTFGICIGRPQYSCELIKGHDMLDSTTNQSTR